MKNEIFALTHDLTVIKLKKINKELISSLGELFFPYKTAQDM